MTQLDIKVHWWSPFVLVPCCTLVLIAGLTIHAKATADTRSSYIGGRAAIGSYSGGVVYSVYGQPGKDIRTKIIKRNMIYKDGSARSKVENGVEEMWADGLDGWIMDVREDPLRYGALSYFDFVKNQCEDVIGEQTERCVALCKKHEETCLD